MKKFIINSETVVNYKVETINDEGAVKIGDNDTNKEYPIHRLKKNRPAKVFNSVTKKPINERVEFCQSIQEYGSLSAIKLFHIDGVYYNFDGQHRLLAALHYKIPLRFEIFSLPHSNSEEAMQECLKLMQECNSMSKIWGLSQYENSKQDNPALVRLKGLKNEYCNIEKNVLVMIADDKEKFSTSLYLDAFKFEAYKGDSVDEDRIRQIDNLIGGFISKKPEDFNIPADLKRTLSLILKDSETPEKLDKIEPAEFENFITKSELQNLLLSPDQLKQIKEEQDKIELEKAKKQKVQDNQAILKYLIPKMEVEISKAKDDPKYKLPRKEVRAAIKSFIADNDFEKEKLEEALVSADPSKFTKEITASVIADIYSKKTA